MRFSQGSEKLRKMEKNNMTEAVKQTIANPIIRKQQLTLEELKTLKIPISIQGDSVVIEHSLRGWRLRQTVKLNLEQVLATKEKGLIAWKS